VGWESCFSLPPPVAFHIASLQILVSDWAFFSYSFTYPPFTSWFLSDEGLTPLGSGSSFLYSPGLVSEIAPGRTSLIFFCPPFSPPRWFWPSFYLLSHLVRPDVPVGVAFGPIYETGFVMDAGRVFACWPFLNDILCRCKGFVFLYFLPFYLFFYRSAGKCCFLCGFWTLPPAPCGPRISLTQLAKPPFLGIYLSF